MPTFHSSKEDLVDAAWKALVEAGAHHGLLAHVSNRVIQKVPNFEHVEDVDEYNLLVDTIIECAWKAGFRDALRAIEIGAITGIQPRKTPGNGNN